MSATIKSTLPLDQTPSIRHDVSSSNIAAAEVDFRDFLDEDAVITDQKECWRRSNNERVLAALGQVPSVVVLPTTTTQVSQIMKICHARRIPVTSYAGGTSSQGGLISTRGGVCIDFSKFDKILDVNETDLNATVQPGVVWKTLDDHLRKRGFFFPPDPAPEACIGGMVRAEDWRQFWFNADAPQIATNAAGTNAYRYGATKSWIISLTIVLADGTVVKTGRRPRKSSNGYDLTHLIIGSEGTLGLVTEAIVRITPILPNTQVAIATFKDYRAAVETGIKLANMGSQWDAIEMLCDQSMCNINQAGMSPMRKWKEEVTLFLKMSGSKSIVEDLMSAAQKAAKEGEATSFEGTGDPDKIEILWSGRKITARATVAMKSDPSDTYVVSDAAVPLTKLVEAMDFSYRKLNEYGFKGAITTHLGDGNFHVKVICPKAEKQKAKDVVRAISLEAAKLQGTISGEHGIGLELRDELVDELGETTVDMMRRIKFALDPLLILNSDKVVRLEA